MKNALTIVALLLVSAVCFAQDNNMYSSPLEGVEAIAITGHYAGISWESCDIRVINVWIPRRDAGSGQGIHVMVLLTGKVNARFHAKPGDVLSLNGKFAFYDDPDFGRQMVVQAMKMTVLRLQHRN